MFCRLLIFFSKSTFSKYSFGNTIRVSNSLDPDQARHFVGPHLGRAVCQSYQQMTLVGEDLMGKYQVESYLA